MRLHETLAQYTIEAEHGIHWFSLVVEFAIAALFLIAAIWGLNALQIKAGRDFTGGARLLR